jgi:hypothetical protein
MKLDYVAVGPLVELVIDGASAQHHKEDNPSVLSESG